MFIQYVAMVWLENTIGTLVGSLAVTAQFTQDLTCVSMSVSKQDYQTCGQARDGWPSCSQSKTYFQYCGGITLREPKVKTIGN